MCVLRVRGGVVSCGFACGCVYRMRVMCVRVCFHVTVLFRACLSVFIHVCVRVFTRVFVAQDTPLNTETHASHNSVT